MTNYFKELKTSRRVMYVGPSGLEIIINPDGTKEHTKLSPQERNEMNIKIKIQNLIAKSVNEYEEYRHLISIPTQIGLIPLEVFSEILDKKMKPQEGKDYLLELERFHGLTWRG